MSRRKFNNIGTSRMLKDAVIDDNEKSKKSKHKRA
jgi:hypothetical protein